MTKQSSISFTALVFFQTGLFLLFLIPMLLSASVLRAEYKWRLPHGLPRPFVPESNPMSVAKIELGRRLFYDQRLSVTGKMSCATCHQPARAFTDGRATAVGATGEQHPRNTPSLGNVVYQPVLTWSHPTLTRLEDQLLIPIFGTEPIEMGMVGRKLDIIEIFQRDPSYRKLFKAAFRENATSTLDNMAKALASFQRNLITGNSAYDRDDLSAAAKRGAALFFSEKLNCFRCHPAPFFTDSVTRAELGFEEIAFHNSGLYDVDGRGSYPSDNTGLHTHTGRSEDMGRFRTPSLRNVEVTAPYMHDGSISTLSEVIDMYAAGGRKAGRQNPYKSVFVTGFSLKPAEKRDLITFLTSLTDHAFLTDPRHADPFR